MGQQSRPLTTRHLNGELIVGVRRPADFEIDASSRTTPAVDPMPELSGDAFVYGRRRAAGYRSNPHTKLLDVGSVMVVAAAAAATEHRRHRGHRQRVPTSRHPPAAADRAALSQSDVRVTVAAVDTNDRRLPTAGRCEGDPLTSSGIRMKSLPFTALLAPHGSRCRPREQAQRVHWRRAHCDGTGSLASSIAHLVARRQEHRRSHLPGISCGASKNRTCDLILIRDAL